MSATIEREIKLRFDTPDDARAAVARLGASPLHGRRFQEDVLLDTPDETLRRQRCVLRVRNEGQRAWLTFKGPAQPGPVKAREELETIVSDGDTVRTICERLGMHVWFRYQKHREEYSYDDVVIAVDETPVGTFVEIEGSVAGIERTATALGRTPTDYILDSYHRLFLANREILGFSGHDMVFDEPDRLA